MVRLYFDKCPSLIKVYGECIKLIYMYYKIFFQDNLLKLHRPILYHTLFSYSHLTIFVYSNFIYCIYLQDKTMIDPFLIPLIIIGGKYDVFQVSLIYPLLTTYGR